MADQFIRRVSLVVADESGDGIDLSEMHIRFAVKQWDLQTPNSARIRIWNLSDTTARKIEKEFTRVVLQAGYEGGEFGVIFDGTIVQVRRGRENATDTYLDIAAADGDAAYNFAVVNASLAAGSKPGDRYKATVEAMTKYGVTQGYQPENLGDDALPRGRVLFGMARDRLTEITDNSDTTWSVQNGQVQSVERSSYLPETAVVLNSRTGMIGMPEQTEDGISVRCLLNPRLKVNGRVQIDNESIQRAQVNLQYTAINYFPSIADDGFYRVIVIDYTGNTRGQDWYCDLVCIALDSTVTQGLAARGYS